MGGEAR